MKDYFYLIPIALGLGLAALVAFMWSLKARQYDDLEGAAVRILEENNDVPIRTKSERCRVEANGGESGSGLERTSPRHPTDQFGVPPLRDRQGI